MNKISLENEKIVLQTYKELLSIRKTSRITGVNKNTVVRVLKDANYNKKAIQNNTPRWDSRTLKNEIFHFWIETEPLYLKKILDNKIKLNALREGRMRFLMENGDTYQIKEYNNLNNVTYWIMKAENWKAKITTKTITISLKVKGKEPLSMMEAANDIIFDKIQNIHKRLGGLFYINAGIPNLRFKTSSSEFGLISPKIYDKLKEMGFRFWSDGFNKVYIDKSPKKSIECSGLDSSLFISRFYELCNWIFENKPQDIATKQDVTMALIKCGVLNVQPEKKESLSNYIG